MARNLDMSPTHDVYHEHDKSDVPQRSMWQYTNYEPLDVSRWLAHPRPRGECHQFLLPSLIGPTGPERLIPRRAILLRPTKDTVRSWIRNRNNCPEDVSWITHEVICRQRMLTDYAIEDLDCRIVFTDWLTVEDLQDFVDWLEIDVTVNNEWLVPRFPTPDHRRWEWTPEALYEYDRITERCGEPVAAGTGGDGQQPSQGVAGPMLGGAG